MFCPSCKAEYRSGFTKCSECGVRLVYRFPTEFSAVPDDDTELVTVRTYHNKFEVDLAKATLEAAGIDSMIRSDDYGGRGPHFSFVHGIELLVRSEDADDADQILGLDVR